MSTDTPAPSATANVDEKTDVKAPLPPAPERTSESGAKEKIDAEGTSKVSKRKVKESQEEQRLGTASTVGRNEKGAIGAVATTDDGEKKVDEPAEEQDIEIEYLPPLRLALLTFGLAMVIFVVRCYFCFPSVSDVDLPSSIDCIG